jgi:UDP-3-O-[3-hydroxymyristoyl] glucosamine N-acyltransferase
MKFTAQQIADLLHGEIVGDESTEVWSVAKIEEAKLGDICFLANEKYEQYISTTKASVILISKNLVPQTSPLAILIIVDDAYASFAKLLHFYEQAIASNQPIGIESGSHVSPTAQIGSNVYIAAFAYIGANAIIGDGAQIYPNAYIGEGVKIGSQSIIYSNVNIYKHCIIGERVIIHSSTVIGSDGFGFAFENGAFKKIPQIGNVIIEDDVEIGANCTIDRATMGSTKICKGVKLDNLVQVAHNVEIGENTVIAAQAGISGSTKIGKYCMIGGQAGIVGHIKIADGTKINAQSGVAKEVKTSGQSLTGSPAFDYKSTIKSQIIFRNLPDLQTRINQLEHKLAEVLKSKSGE